MELQTPDWKAAWHDQHLSERFLKEWNRLESRPLRDISGTAAWMNQLVIELGQLAQSMIHLEESTTHASHVRLAAERSLKLSVMAARLAGALDASYRQITTDAAEFLLHDSSAPGAPRGGPVEGVVAQQSSETTPARGQDSVDSAAAGSAPAPVANTAAAPPRLAASTYAAHQVAATPAAAAQGEGSAEGVPAPAAPRNDRAQPFMVPARDPRMLMQPRKPPAMSQEQERLVLANSPRNLETEHRANERPMSLTIRSLSDRGLSLDEIELVTGQPRSTIETVLSTH